MDVSVCIVNWNTSEQLRECIYSIKKKTVGVNYEIIIVDNNSSDGSADMIKNYYQECTLIVNNTNLGFTKGNNLAVQHATGRYILYLNPDTKLITNALRGMFSFLEENKDYGAVGCKLINVDGTIQYTCACTFPGPLNELCQFLLLHRVFRRFKITSSRLLDYWDHHDSRNVDCLSGACMMVRREIVDVLDGFDTNIYMYADDIDLCYRIAHVGNKIYYLATETIIHEGGASTAKTSNNLFAPLMQCQSNYYFIAKHHGPLKAAQYRSAIAVGALFRTMILAVLTPVSKFNKTRIGNIRDVLNKYWNIALWSFGFIKVKDVQR